MKKLKKCFCVVKGNGSYAGTREPSEFLGALDPNSFDVVENSNTVSTFPVTKSRSFILTDGVFASDTGHFCLDAFVKTTMFESKKSQDSRVRTRGGK